MKPPLNLPMGVRREVMNCGADASVSPSLSVEEEAHTTMSSGRFLRSVCRLERRAVGLKLIGGGRTGSEFGDQQAERDWRGAVL